MTQKTIKRRKRELSERQIRFVSEYMIDLEPAKAYIRAGYSGSNPGRGAYRLMENPKIKQAIELASKKVQTKAAWDAAWVRNKLAWLANEAQEQGNLTVLRATLETMSKCEGMQIQNHNVNNSERISFSITTGRGERVVGDSDERGTSVEHTKTPLTNPIKHVISQ